MNEVRALAVGGIVSFLAQCFQVKVSFCRSFPSCLAENSSLAPDPKVLTLWRCMIHSWTQGASRCGQHSAPPAHRNARKQTGGGHPIHREEERWNQVSGASLFRSEMLSGNLGTERWGNVPNLPGITCKCQGLPSNMKCDSRRWWSCNVLSTSSQKRRRVFQLLWGGVRHHQNEVFYPHESN